MILLNTFLYYVCFASAILVYGIGIDKTTQVTYLKNVKFAFLLKILLSILISSLISWLIIDKLLIPLDLNELYPVICLLVFIFIATLLEGIFRITTKASSTEFVFSYMVVLLTVSESVYFLDTFFISLSCLISILILLPVVYAFKVRIIAEEDNLDKYLCRLFLFLGILLLIFTVWDIMWMNPEVIQ